MFSALATTLRQFVGRKPETTNRVASVRSGDPGGLVLSGGYDAASMALSSAAVWACCRLISQSVATCPPHIFEETDQGKIKASKHSYYRMLTRQPNALMTYLNWMQTTVLHLLLWGNAFTVPGSVDGEVVELWPLDPARLRITINPDGTFYYTYSPMHGQRIEYQPLELLHFRVFSLDGIIGLSPLDYHRLTFNFEAAAQLYATTLYNNGGRPSGVLEYPGTLRKEQIDAIRESWATIHGGPDAAGRVAVLDAGTKYNPISIPLEQLQYISSQKFSVEQIARIFGVPPHLVGAQDKTPYASVEQQSLEFAEYTLQPIVTAIEQVIETVLLEPPFIFRLNLSGFARADLATRYRAYAVGRQWGWFSVNDIRELEDLNRIGPDGDIYLQPLNMTPAGEDPTAALNAPTNPTPNPEGINA